MTSFENLAFKPHFLPLVQGSDRVLLLSEAGPRYLLRGALYALLAPLLDGTRTLEQIVKELPRDVDPDKTRLALRTLLKKGYVEEHSGSLPRAQAAFWSALGITPAAAAQRLKQTTVSVITLGGNRDDASALSSALENLRIPVIAEASAALTVVLVEDYLQAGLSELNLRMRAAERRWLPVKAVGQLLWFGPFFGPGNALDAGPCWACLARRLRCNRPAEVAAEGFNSGLHPMVSVASLPSTKSLAFNLAATGIARWIAQDRTGVTDRILTFDLQTLQTQTHKVRRLDECEVCGRAPDFSDPADGVEIVLQSIPKPFKGDGGDRACSPDETWARLSALVSPITGIAPEPVRADSSAGLPVYYVKQITPPGTAMKLGERAFATGKGETELQAKISCLGEAVERYCCGFRGNERRIVARLSELGSQGLHPGVLQHFSARQYAGRKAWNATNPGFHWVPEPFDEAKATEWSPGWSLSHQEIRWLPTPFCYFIQDTGDSKFFCQSDSNGCAAGNTREEAILQGFLELVERDSMALFWYNRAKRPSIRLQSFNHPYFERIQDAYAAKGRQVAVLDLTTEMGIPVALALSWKTEGQEILLGLGAHLNPRTAVSRALSELNQMEHQAELWTRRRDTEPPPVAQQDRDVTAWLRNATLENQPWLIPDESPAREAADLRRLDGDNLLGDVQTCIEIVRNNKMELIVMDLTRTDVDFPVVRVIVPGLRHFWARLGPGRLYEAPANLGWVPKKLDEAELNPIPCFL